MRINDITVFSYSADYAHGTYTMSRGRVCTGQPSIVVRIRTDDGHEGWAETAPLGSDYLPSSFSGELAALKELGPVLLGLDPRSPVVINAAMDHVMMSGMAAKAVLDVACWDILGKAMQLPTATLLGGRLADDLSAFSVIGVGDPITGVEKARGELEKGLKAMQLKVGDDPLGDARRVKAIREAMPDSIELWADANGGWNLDQALRFCRALGQDITVALEQPCRLLSDCAEVGRRTGLPITLDESIVTMADLVAAYTAGITGVNIKVSRVGGFTKARLLRDAAVALDMMVTIDDTWGCALTTAQNIQMAASTPRDKLRAVDLFAEWTSPAIAEIPRMQSTGLVTHPSLPGNGFGTIDIEILGEPLFSIKA
ncbi:enolase C-terminal domain-like protein [Aspergillus parasiticus]|uniref:Enolase C-terminal domain-like protein n=1 Tax=Aspergillus parasiticus TaxID=5067 RepID=A0A5N6DHK4_ASPPA|nr:enolase C-terminal domain-like protein [Aspergillus parasiticus]